MTATARKKLNTLATWDSDELVKKLDPFRPLPRLSRPATTASRVADEPQLIDKKDLPALPEGLSDWMRDALDPEGSGDDAFARYDDDRSRAVLAAATHLSRAGWLQDEVLTALWSGPVASLAIEKRDQSDTKGLAYLKASVTKAREFVESRRTRPEDVFSALPDLGGDAQGGSNVVPGWPQTQVSKAEAEAARLTPTEIVKGLLFADLAALIAPGGLGKSTLVLEAGTGVALGARVFGREVKTPGRVLYITGEDAREQLAARRERIMDSQFLSEGEKQRVRETFGIWDVSGGGVKLTCDRNGNIVPTSIAQQIVEAYKDEPPVLVIFDPVVSFGTSEGRPNDNEQGIVAAARQIIRGLGCCVLLVHHTGKGNARDKTTDQYSGRGGSALADGSRMVFVLTRWDGTGGGGSARPPEALGSVEDSEILQLHPAKTSYAPRDKARTIWIKRTGFAFQFAQDVIKTPGAVRADQDQAVMRFLREKLTDSFRFTKRQLEDSASAVGLPRQQIRETVDRLLSRGQIELRPLPEGERHGRRREYLHPLDDETEREDATDCSSHCAASSGALDDDDALF